MKHLLRRLLAFLRAHLRWVNILLAAAAWAANRYNQVFCQPVTWAGWVLAVSAGAFLFWPWLGQAPRWVRYVALFVQGTALAVCAYCAFFLKGTLLLSLLLFWLGLPLLGLIPYFFGWQLMRRAGRSELPNGRWVFLAGALALLPAQLWVARHYAAVDSAAWKLKAQGRLSVAALAAALPADYVSERITGLYFRYHTNEDLIEDGWRPPLHDPLINVCYWLSYRDPLPIPFAARVALYRKLFPARPVKADCVCGFNGARYGESYALFGSPDARTADDRAGQPGFRWPADSVLR